MIKMPNVRVLVLTLLALALGATAATAQRGGGRYSLEYEGALTGGVTGVRATYAVGSGGLVLDLPAVVASYPTVRLVRGAGLPDRPMQAEFGGADGFALEFSHPDLPARYVAQRGTVRIAEVAGGRIRGDFAVVAVPAGQGSGPPLTLRGQFDAAAR